MAETAKKTHVQTALKHKWNPMHNMANDFHKKQPTISLCPEGPGAIAPGPSGHRLMVGCFLWKSFAMLCMGFHLCFSAV